MSVDLRLISGEPEEMAALQQVLESAPTYAGRVTRHPPGPADTQNLMTILPPDNDYADKFMWGIMLDGEMVGCADMIRGWPSADTAHIGLLLLDEAHVGRGLGRGAYEAIEAQVRRWPQVHTLRLASWPPTPRSWLSGIAWASARQAKSGPTTTTSSSRSRSLRPSHSDRPAQVRDLLQKLNPSAGFNPVPATCGGVLCGWGGAVGERAGFGASLWVGLVSTAAQN